MSRVLRSGAAGAALLAAVVTISCFEPPVTESLRIVFDAEGKMTMVAVTRFSSDKSATENPAAASRLDSLRTAIARGDDTWGRVARRLEPDAQKDTFEYAGGILQEASREILVEDPGKVRLVFSESPLKVFLTRRGELWILQIIPGTSDRATQRQVRSVHEGLARFGGSVSNYVKAVAALYDYLKANPERARDCFADIFEDLTKKAPRESALSEEETALVKTVKDRMGDVFGILELKEGEEYTLDELSHLVYDPFPAPLELETSAPPEEVEGFAPRGERTFAAAGPGLWEALASLKGQWVSPDPVLIYVGQMLHEGGPNFDLDEFLSEPRSVRGQPDADAVRHALEEHLRPAERYLLKWQVPTKEKASKESQARELGGGNPAPSSRTEGFALLSSESGPTPGLRTGIPAGRDAS